RSCPPQSAPENRIPESTRQSYRRRRRESSGSYARRELASQSATSTPEDRSSTNLLLLEFGISGGCAWRSPNRRPLILLYPHCVTESSVAYSRPATIYNQSSILQSSRRRNSM